MFIDCPDGSLLSKCISELSAAVVNYLSLCFPEDS